MAGFPVPSIFLTTLFAVAAILSLATLIGRAWGELLPLRLRSAARFYLAPVLGLASLTVFASLFGRFLPLGNSVFVPLLTAGALLWAVVRERHKNQAFQHALMVSFFGIVCGVSVLSPLLVYGALNAHNDTFTYLAHSNWLQLHAFSETISKEMVTPLTTQVVIYQQGGLRMGGSFLLALLQAVLNLHWSYEVYPALVVSAIAACCLAIGFPFALALRPLRRSVRLALLALPAFSLGGLVFGANLGFLPQTVGLAAGAASLFLAGPLFKWIATSNDKWQTNFKAALPGAALIAGAIFAYSELAPFLLVAIAGSGLVLALRFHAWRKLLAHGGALLGISFLTLNTELIRAYAALRAQSGAVVGTPVEWTLLGYVAHAFGIHGGAWDGFQWSTPENARSLALAFGLVLLCSATGLVLAAIRPIWRATLSGALLPTIAVLAIFAVGVVYFRYFVPAPFPKGMGQSWSQFKLADWAHPFVMALVLLAIASLRPRLGRLFTGAVATLFIIGIVGAGLAGIARMQPIVRYYSGVSDLNRFYLKFRDTVIDTCPTSAPIYLALGGENYKFRQLAALYLFDREVRSDWTDDGYIYPSLPEERRTQELTVGSCVVERKGQNGWLSKGLPIGPFLVGVFDGRGQIRIASVTGAFDRESDGQNWWHWVEHRVSFKLAPLFVPKDATLTKLKFEYGVRGNQTLTVHLRTRDGSTRQLLLQAQAGAPRANMT